jgi:hypothetical protein
MSRLAVLSVLIALILPAKAQVFPGPPASATSPTSDGRLHGAPASVLSPTPPLFVPGHRPVAIGSGKPLRPFGTPRRRQIFIPVPLFFPVYGAGYDNAYPSVADPAVGQSADPGPAQSAGNDSDVAGSEEALRRAYVQGAHDALAQQQQADSRYGPHYMDSRESVRPKQQASASKPEPAPADDSPATVFIFKDGHQIETRNFAIMGQTLYDFSRSSLTKLQLTDLDAVATVKANDDRGITVKLQ